MTKKDKEQSIMDWMEITDDEVSEIRDSLYKAYKETNTYIDFCEKANELCNELEMGGPQKIHLIMKFTMALERAQNPNPIGNLLNFMERASSQQTDQA